MRVRRLVDHPIISPLTHPDVGTNINGPSLVRVPDWVEDPLGTYYLYFAHHRGEHIRLAVADELGGPWSVHPGGVLGLDASHFLTEPPAATAAEIEAAAELVRAYLGEEGVRAGIVDDLTVPHIASPDVRVDDEDLRFEMAFHGLAGLGVQLTRLAHSATGVDFVVDPTPLAGVYLRSFRHAGVEYALTMPGRVHRRSGRAALEAGPDLLPAQARHSAIRVRGDRLQIFWTRVGDAPERILVSEVDASTPWLEWTAGPAAEVLRPEREWEGAALPLVPSVRSLAPGPVNEVRDPAIFEEDGHAYLLYAVAGESGLGIAELVD